MKNQLLVLTMLKRPVTSCRVCGKKDTETDRYGRCHGCYKAKLATDMGVRYGQLVTRPDFAELDKWHPFGNKPEKQPEDVKMAVCPVCGDSFRKVGNKLYCSVSCCNRAQAARARERDKARYQKRSVGIENVCAWCGKQFTLKYNNQQYCSDACALARRKALAMGRAVIKTCPNCGTEFQARSKTQTYCSKHCSSVAVPRKKAKKNAAD